MTLPTKAYVSFDAACKAIYRMRVSKEYLLEWTTSKEIENKNKNELELVYKKCFPNVIFGILIFIFTFILNAKFYIKLPLYFLGIIYILFPIVMQKISKTKYESKKVNKLSKDEVSYVKDIAKRTWEYFSNYMNKENSYLPPDNYQENRREKLVHRTSSTNIGLGILSIISAYDLKFISLEDAVIKLENSLYTIERLEKWNGHLFNWYDTKTLLPLRPKYVSTVDSGNFVGYMYTLKAFLEEKANTVYKDRIKELLELTDKIIDDTDFSYLYNEKNRLLSIGYNVEENELTDNYYDLLATEARQASLIAIAKKQVSSKHWNNLSRTLTKLGKYKGLISWSGTAFEYLMPNINIKKYEGSLLDESCKFMIISQMKYAARLRYTLGNIRGCI